jgi:hypothetical protein
MIFWTNSTHDPKATDGKGHIEGQPAFQALRCLRSTLYLA